jgi:Tannase and feruloyl esterase
MFPAANTFDAMDTNLTAFRRHGGKLIMWQGWADNGIPPSGTVDYYDTLIQRMGGPHATRQFARLFLFPSVYHCSGGYANATTPDLIYPMVQWVEQGMAPRRLTISYAPAGTTSLSRPVYPYPYIRNTTEAAIRAPAASFSPVKAPAAAQGTDYTNWYGNYLFSQPIGGGGQATGYIRHR